MHVLRAAVIALLLAGPAVAAADAPRIEVERQARITDGGDLVVRVTCVEPAGGSVCRGTLRVNGATGGGSRAVAAFSANIRTDYAIREDRTANVRFGNSSNFLGGLAKAVIGNAGEAIHKADGLIRKVMENVPEVAEEAGRLRPELKGVSDSLRDLKPFGEVAETIKAFAKYRRVGKELGERLQNAAAQEQISADEAVKAINEATRTLKGIVEKLDVMIYRGIGRGMSLGF